MRTTSFSCVHRRTARLRLAVAAGLSAAWLAACGTDPGAGETAATPPRSTPVRVAEVGWSEQRPGLRLPGVVRAADRARPAFLHAGQLAERFVARGERVVAGQRLASLQNPALGPALTGAEARVRELDAQLVQLDAELVRARELHEQKLASAEGLDRAQAQRDAAREARAQALAQVTEARDQLADAVLRAPFSAVVSDLLVEPGDFVPAGQAVMVLSGDAGLEVEIRLPEGLAATLNTGQPVEVRAVASGAITTGHIRELGVARAGMPAPAVVALPDADDWEPGTSVHVSFAETGQPALRVPLAAILDPGTGQTRVFRVIDGRAVLTVVTAGRLAGAEVEVAGALSAGDQVVVAGQQQLLDGEAVRILP